MVRQTWPYQPPGAPRRPRRARSASARDLASASFRAAFSASKAASLSSSTVVAIEISATVRHPKRRGFDPDAGTRWRRDPKISLERVDDPGQQIHARRNIAGGDVFQTLDAGVIFEDRMPEQGLPFSNHHQPLFRVLQAGLGLAQGLFLLGHRRVVVGFFLKITPENVGPRHRHLLPAPLDLVMPVRRTLLLQPSKRPANFGLDRPQASQSVLAVHASATRKLFSSSIEWTAA